MTGLRRALSICSSTPVNASRKPRGFEANRILSRGAMFRKSAFRECGLFRTDLLFQRREHQEWVSRADRQGRTGLQLDTATLHTNAIQTRGLPPKVDRDFLKTQLDRRRQKTVE